VLLRKRFHTPEPTALVFFLKKKTKAILVIKMKIKSKPNIASTRRDRLN
jgi:hypothetical protein